jgi:tRNA nucleotidyltransferase (CCA-adding enzyme)
MPEAEGFKQGKEIGVVLNKLMEVVLENPSLNNRETLLEIARELI